MAEIEEDGASPIEGTKGGGGSVDEQAEDSVEAKSMAPASTGKGGSEADATPSKSESPLYGRLEVDPAELSSDLSEIEDDSDHGDQGKPSRHPSKVSRATSSRKSTANKPAIKAQPKSVAVHAPPKRSSPRLSPPQQPDQGEGTESIDEESTDTRIQTQAKAFLKGRVYKAKSSEPGDEIQGDSLPAPRARKATPAKPSLTSPDRKSGSSVKRRAPHVAPAIAIAKHSLALDGAVSISATSAAPAPVPVALKRQRSSSPPSAPRTKTKTTIVDAPAYPKRRKVTDPSPRDSQALYETTLEPERVPTAKTTLEEQKAAPVSKKRYGKEKKERKVAAETRKGRGGGDANGRAQAAERASEDSSHSGDDANAREWRQAIVTTE